MILFFLEEYFEKCDNSGILINSEYFIFSFVNQSGFDS